MRNRIFSIIQKEIFRDTPGELNEPEYLGDGVTAVMEGDQIKLTAGANLIYLEPEVYQALVRFVRNGDENEKRLNFTRLSLPSTPHPT